MANDYLPTMAGTTTPTASPSSAPLRLAHLSGSLTGKTPEVSPGVITFGRHPECAVRFDHAVDFLVSTRHGQLAFEDGRWWFVDTNSTNGTFVNGARIQRQALANGMVVSLGTPGAPGGASFRADIGPGAAAAPPVAYELDAPFAQEPPPSDENISFTCSQCGARNSASSALAGQTMSCAACGRQTRIPTLGGPGGGFAVQREAAASMPHPLPPPPPPAYAPTSFQGIPPVGQSAATAAPDQGGDAGFFGGIIGGIKSNMNRRRERKELQREIAALEQMVPQLDTQLQQACTFLGQEIWRVGKDQVGQFRGAQRLAEADAAVVRADERQAAVDQEFGQRTNEYQSWLADWQEQSAQIGDALKNADQALHDAHAEQAWAKGAVIAAIAGKAEVLAATAQQAAEMAAEARTDPRDDFADRFTAWVDAIAGQVEHLKEPIVELPALLAARTAAAEAVAATTQAQADVAAKAEQKRRERIETDTAHGAMAKAHEQQQAGHRSELERIRGQLPPLHAELGRHFVDTPSPPSFNPPIPQVAAAKIAADHLNQTQAQMSQKRKRLAELDAM